MRTCSVADCERPVRGKGLCGMHYARLRRNGTTDAIISSPVLQVLPQWLADQQRDRPNGCWLWPWALQPNGYGAFRKSLAHRFIYEYFHGPLPKGKGHGLDHLCRVRACVNPAHLEFVPQRVNVLRGNGLAGQNARKTHCQNGHPFTPENTYIQNARGARLCITCKNAWTRRYRALKRAARRAVA